MLERRLLRRWRWSLRSWRHLLGQCFLNMNIAPVKHRHERGHGVGIKALSRKILNNAQSFYRIVRLLVRTIRGQSVKRVRHRDYPRQQRDFVAF